MVSGIMHLIFLILALIIGAGIYGAYRRGKSKNKQLRDFSLFFILLAAYRFCLFFPLIFLGGDLEIAYWSYNLAILIFFMMSSVAFKISLNILKLNAKKIKFYLITLLSVGGITVLAQVICPRLPIIDSSGLVFWNANPFSAWATSLSGFFVSMIWVYTFIENFPSNVGLLEKTKTILIIITAIFLGISSLAFYPFNNHLATIITFITIFISSVCILLAILISFFIRR